MIPPAEEPDALDAEAHELSVRAHALHARAARCRAQHREPAIGTGPVYGATVALIDKAGLARALDVSTPSVDRYCARGVIPYVTLGPDGPRRFVLNDVLAALAKHDAAPVAVAPPKREPIAGVRLLSRGVGR